MKANEVMDAAMKVVRDVLGARLTDPSLRNEPNVSDVDRRAIRDGICKALGVELVEAKPVDAA